ESVIFPADPFEIAAGATVMLAGVDTVVVPATDPVTVSVAVSVPVPAPVVTTTVAAVALVTFWDTLVTLPTPDKANTVLPLHDVPAPVSDSVIFPADPLGIEV